MVSHKNVSETSRYARGFVISMEGNYRKLTVRNPWEKAKNIDVDYYLVDKNGEIPAWMKDKNIIRTPVENIICLSTTHIAFLDALDEIDKLTGVSGSIYISNRRVTEKIAQNKIVDVGYDQNLNYEEIIRINPDLVMAYGVDSEITNSLNKFRDLGVTVLLNADYLEPSPLGKSEWIKFVGALFNKEAMADSIFCEIERNYLALSQHAGNVVKKPKVMMGFPYRDAWWVPGGDSYMSLLIADAGGDYLGKENPSHESFVISFEDALMWASQADLWLNVGMLDSKAQMLNVDARFEKFKTFREGKIYNNNRRTTSLGGNDFWESSIMFPDLILADLIRIFHAGLLPADTLTYYKLIE
ncbi:MAG: ABC transporter substrate-binding protein [Prolixibacteraceae bacterium]|nr:ABC transporter substrate-binding protein [Prolixibacteraceae bacterium]